MKCNSSKPASREAVLAAVRLAVEAAGGKRVTLPQFLAGSGMNRGDVFRYFARWEEALKEAGAEVEPHNDPIDPARLLADWGTVARALQRTPTRADYRVRGKFNAATMERRFGGWRKVREAFRAFAKEQVEWADVETLLGEGGRETRDRNPNMTPATGGRRWMTRGRCEANGANGADGTHERGWTPKRNRVKRLADRPTYGEPLDFEAMRHEPVNESGVVLLFGMVAMRMGFLIEAMRTNFPDCEAKLRLSPGEWQRVRIEFEFESRNFRDHGHDPKGCDLIVCWAHNWPECPVEVIALRDFVPQREMTKSE